MQEVNDPLRNRQWFIVGRWQEYEGEGRANLLRVVGVGVFYAIQLLHYYVFSNGAESQRGFHQAATALAVVWTLLALGVLLCLRREFFPAALKYVSTSCDLVLLTALGLVGSRGNSPLVFVYFVILAMAALRFSLPLIWFSTLGAMIGYEVLVAGADPVWFDANHLVPPVENLMMLASLGLTGILLGQIVRRVRGMAEDYAARIQLPRTPEHEPIVES